MLEDQHFAVSEFCGKKFRFHMGVDPPPKNSSDFPTLHHFRIDRLACGKKMQSKRANHWLPAPKQPTAPHLVSKPRAKPSITFKRPHSHWGRKTALQLFCRSSNRATKSRHK